MRLAAIVAMGALAIVCASCRCREEAPIAEPGATALRMFAAARQDGMSDTHIAALFDVEAGSRGKGRLLDAVSRLAEASEPRVVGTTALERDDRAVVDVTANLAAGGAASYSVAMRRDAGGAWRIHAFWGPGVSWPDRATAPAEGLSVSPPPR